MSSPISFTSNTTNTSNIGIIERIAKRCPDNLLPSMSRTIASLGSEMRPSHNRFALGILGFLLQPVIDFFNPYVDDDTAKTAGIRTAAKNVITPASGILARELGQAFGDRFFSKRDLSIPKGIVESIQNLSAEDIQYESKFFSKSIQKQIKDAGADLGKMKNILSKAKYARGIGNVAAIIAAVASSFCIDMIFIDPLTNKVLEWTGRKPSCKNPHKKPHAPELNEEKKSKTSVIINRLKGNKAGKEGCNEH